ncbi:MAG: hypothetical protein IH939_15085 [Acidobacteria bacterium]|nr:hypothetical protein [Acidobacteriota bacterium]
MSSSGSVTAHRLSTREALAGVWTRRAVTAGLIAQAQRSLAACGESPAACRWRCIRQVPALAFYPAGSKTAGMLPRLAVQGPCAVSISTTLGATRDGHPGLLGLRAGSAT